MKIFTWKQRAIVLGVNAATLFCFCAVGYLADLRFGTRPWGLVAGLLLSFPFGQYLLAKILIRNYYRDSKG